MMERGWTVTVVTPRDDRIGSVEYSKMSPKVGQRVAIGGVFNPAFFNRALFGPLRFGFNTRDQLAGRSGAVHAVVRTGLEKTLVAYLHLLKTSNIGDPFALWSRQVISRASRLMKEKPFDIVYASVPPVSPVIVACEIAARVNAKLVVDYRDPWIDPVFERRLVEISPRILAGLRAQENECLYHADLVSAVSPSLVRELGSKTSKRVLFAPHGVPDSPAFEDPEDDRDSESFSFPYLFYAGALFYGRSLSTILRALKSLRSGGGPHVRLVYCGQNVALAESEAQSVDASDHLVARGYIPHHRVKMLSKQALANLLLVSSGYEYSYPGKLWDQIAAGQPIVCLSASSGVSAQLIRERQLGFVHATDDESGLTESVRRLMNGEITIDPDACRDLSRVQIIDGLLDNVASLFD